MRRLLPILAAATLLAALAASATQASARTGLAPAREFAPRQLVVKFAGERSGRAVGLPDGAGVRRAAAALRRNPRVAYAEPNYVATASAASPNFDFTLPDDPGHPRRRLRSGNLDRRLDLQAVELPALGRRLDLPPAGLPGRDRRGRRLAQPRRNRPARGRRGDRRRARHRHRLPQLRQQVRPQPRLHRQTSSSRATTSSTVTACRSTKTATAPTSPARSPRRPATRSASPGSPTGRS